MADERVFVGSRIQKGHGLGGFFASMFRRALPLFKKGGEYLVKKVARTGVNTFHDIASGVNPRQALKRRITEVSDEMLDDVKRKIRRTMTGQGVHNKRSMKRSLKRIKKKVTRRSVNRCRDIFDE